ncbi:MAG: hypothetical protein UZ05_CHB002001995 [Chlorobi bacterium OLB5]|nr:MAG: hypothetical protein UZ05_CHB002001995 [Chlorobi bacterium OLB5]
MKLRTGKRLKIHSEKVKPVSEKWQILPLYLFGSPDWIKNVNTLIKAGLTSGERLLNRNAETVGLTEFFQKILNGHSAAMQFLLNIENLLKLNTEYRQLKEIINGS